MVSPTEKFRNLQKIIKEAAILSQLPISKVHKTFDDQGNLLDENYERRFSGFLDEFEWYADALKKQRMSGISY